MDGLRDYLNQIGRWPLLTPAQEINLARLHQKGLAVRKSLGARKPTKAERRAIRIGDRAGRRMVECNMRLVVSIAKKYTRHCRTNELCDLIQYGAIGLQRAAEKFDPERGYKFSTYASPWIRQEVGRGIYRSDNTIYLPEHRQEQWLNLGKRASAFAQEHGRFPTQEELLEGSGLTAESYAQVSSVMRGAVSLDIQTHEDGDTIGALLASPDGEPKPLGDHEKLMLCVEELPKKDRDLIASRYGLEGAKPLTLGEIGAEHGVTGEAIRKRMATVRGKLREAMNQPRT